MDNNEIRLWISRILSGTVSINNKKYPVPTLNEASETVYQETFSEAIFLDCFTQEECENLVKKREVDQIAKTIKDLKIELYQLRKNFDAAENVRKKLVAAKKDLESAYRHNRTYFTYSAEYVATYAKEIAFIGADVMGHINEMRPTEEQIREIARSGQWYSMWSSSKMRMFPKRLTDDQSDLVSWTQKYINIIKHPKRPELWVLDDDDMLDGWMLSTNDEEEKRPVPEGDGDIMLFAKTDGDAQKIYDMNSTSALVTIKGRNKLIDKRGNITEQDLPDVKRELALERNKIGRGV